jgi:uncharacterized protein YjiS (DUF1127 family)
MFTPSLARALVAHVRRYQARRVVAGLSDDQLADVGITRHDLFAKRPIAWGATDHPAYQHPHQVDLVAARS